MIPIELLDRPAAVIGGSGSGKTYAAKGAVEKLLGAVRRVCIVDPTGAWCGLRAHAYGTPASRSEIANRLGMKATGGHWNSAWKELRDNEIVVVNAGDIAALTDLFRARPVQ